MTKSKKGAPKPTGYRIYTQYVLVGAALGLYYGIFYRGTPDDQPDFVMAIVLSVLAAAATTIVRYWRKRESWRVMGLDFLKILAMFSCFLLALQLNPVVNQAGGRAAGIIFMTSVGVGLGLLMGVRKKTA